MSALNPDRLRVVDIGTGLAEIRMRIESARRTVHESDAVDSVLEGRLRNAFPVDAWLPVVLIIRGEQTAAERDEAKQLEQELIVRPRLGAAVVVAGANDHEEHSDDQLGTLIDIDADGALQLDPSELSFGERSWRASALSPATSDDLVD